MLPPKSLPLTREVAFAKQMTEGEKRRSVRPCACNERSTQYCRAGAFPRPLFVFAILPHGGGKPPPYAESFLGAPEKVNWPEGPSLRPPPAPSLPNKSPVYGTYKRVP